MAFQLSPGVNVSEVDLTTVVPSVATTVGGFAGNFNWGPVNEITIINNELQLVEKFGKPDSNTATSFFTAANFLSYANDLRVVRAIGLGALNATAGGTGRLVRNADQWTRVDNETFLAKYPGSLGNNIGVSYADATTFSTWDWRNEFNSAPGTSDWADSKDLINDELHVVVYDYTGVITGTVDTILEKYSYVSKVIDAKSYDGSNNHYGSVMNTRSKWVWWMNGESNSNWDQLSTDLIANNDLTLDAVVNAIFEFSGGVDVAPENAGLASAFNLFSNPDSVDVSLIMGGALTSDTIPDFLVTLVESRKDALVFLSPQYSDVVNVTNPTTNIVTYRNTITDSSYVVMDSGWKYQYDKYNDVYRWVPLNGDIAGLCARTDIQRDPWFSPAGYNRGQIKNLVKLSWNPTSAQRDTLYKTGVNPVVTFPGEGTILYGDKTLQSRPSAFDRINVRRLFIVLEKAIAKASRSSLFEFNDEFTRAQFVNLVEPYLRDIQGRRGIYDYRVVCDTTNNTAEVIDRNEFVGDIYIKPARSINFIQLNFVAVRTGVAFNEVVGQF